MSAWDQRRTQLQADQYDEALKQARNDAFLGVFRIPLDNIQTGPPGRETSCKESRTNFKRLQRIFRHIQGCLPRNPLHYISVSVDAALWTDISPRVRVPVNPLLPHDLHLIPGQMLHCLQGKSRIEAAKECLEGPRRWWIAELYKKEPAAADPVRTQQQARLFRHLENKTSNEKRLSDAKILAGIYESDLLKDPGAASQFWALFTRHKEARLRQLIRRRPSLAQCFERCLRLPFLRTDLRLGNFHKMMATMSYEVG